MKKILLTLLLLMPPALLFAEAHETMRADAAIRLLEPLKPDAIELGSGPVEIFVFIDPNCKFSRQFVGMIRDSEKMLTNYHYYFFLYGLARLQSEKAIETIYAAAVPDEAMVGYMLDAKSMQSIQTRPSVPLQRIERIKAAAEAIGVDRRPYMILNKKKSP